MPKFVPDLIPQIGFCAGSYLPDSLFVPDLIPIKQKMWTLDKYLSGAQNHYPVTGSCLCRMWLALSTKPYLILTPQKLEPPYFFNLGVS